MATITGIGRSSALLTEEFRQVGQEIHGVEEALAGDSEEELQNKQELVSKVKQAEDRTKTAGDEALRDTKAAEAALQKISEIFERALGGGERPSVSAQAADPVNFMDVIRQVQGSFPSVGGIHGTRDILQLVFALMGAEYRRNLAEVSLYQLSGMLDSHAQMEHLLAGEIKALEAEEESLNKDADNLNQTAQSCSKAADSLTRAAKTIEEDEKLLTSLSRTLDERGEQLIRQGEDEIARGRELEKATKTVCSGSGKRRHCHQVPDEDKRAQGRELVRRGEAHKQSGQKLKQQAQRMRTIAQEKLPQERQKILAQADEMRRRAAEAQERRNLTLRRRDETRQQKAAKQAERDRVSGVMARLRGQQGELAAMRSEAENEMQLLFQQIQQMGFSFGAFPTFSLPGFSPGFFGGSSFTSTTPFFSGGIFPGFFGTGGLSGSTLFSSGGILGASGLPSLLV